MLSANSYFHGIIFWTAHIDVQPRYVLFHESRDGSCYLRIRSANLQHLQMKNENGMILVPAASEVILLLSINQSINQSNQSNPINQSNGSLTTRSFSSGCVRKTISPEVRSLKSTVLYTAFSKRSHCISLMSIISSNKRYQPHSPSRANACPAFPYEPSAPVFWHSDSPTSSSLRLDGPFPKIHRRRQ